MDVQGAPPPPPDPPSNPVDNGAALAPPPPPPADVIAKNVEGLPEVPLQVPGPPAPPPPTDIELAPADAVRAVVTKGLAV